MNYYYLYNLLRSIKTSQYSFCKKLKLLSFPFLVLYKLLFVMNFSAYEKSYELGKVCSPVKFSSSSSAAPRRSQSSTLLIFSILSLSILLRFLYLPLFSSHSEFQVRKRAGSVRTVVKARRRDYLKDFIDSNLFEIPKIGRHLQRCFSYNKA